MEPLALLAVFLLPIVCSAQATLTGAPNPFTSDLNGLGQITLTWSAPRASAVEIHVLSTAGPLFANTGNSGSATTGEWVTDGMQFYLQDVSNGEPGATPATFTAQAMAVVFNGSPNPFPTDINELGQITLNWSAANVSAVEIRVNSVTGPSLTTGPASGSANTGEWVTDGMQFYLQDISKGEPGTTLAVYTAHAGWLGLPPDTPVLVSLDNGRQLFFNAPGATEVEIHVNKPWGPLFARFYSDHGSAPTGDWIRDGMRFYLQDVSNGQPLTLQHTLATAVATVDTNTPGKVGVIFGATPGLVPDPGNTGLGTATLFWNATGSSGVEVHVNSPDGRLFAQAGASGSAASGTWITDGMRFYLQDTSTGTSTSPSDTLAVATVDLQPSQQHYLSYYRSDSGVLTYSRDSMHLVGTIPLDALPTGVTAVDMHPSPDGTLLYLLGSDFNYYVLDPSTDSVKTSFAAGSQSTSFGFMKGSMNQDLLIQAPDTSENIAIVDPAQLASTVVLKCPCYGSSSGIMLDPATNTPFFVSWNPGNPPAPGYSGLALYSVTPSLQLATPYPLQYPPTWHGTPYAGISYLMLNSGEQGTLLVTWTQLDPQFFPYLPTDLVAYDVATQTATALTQSFTLGAALAIPELASTDGTSIYAQPVVLHFVSPDVSGTPLLGDLSRFESRGTTLRFSWESTFPMDNQPRLVTPPLALDDHYVFFGQVSILGSAVYPFSAQPSSPFYLYRADPSTLQPVGFERIIVDNNPTSARTTPLVGLSTGVYTWPPLVSPK
ncbi:MAG: hypothetical protein WBW33_21800 [Bryobacteraceae bacterium]